MKITDLYERIVGPYTVPPNTFVYSDGYPLRENKLVWLAYFKKDKKEVYLDIDKKQLFLRNPKKSTNFAKYKLAKPNLKREIYLKPFKPVINDKIRKTGSFQRGFAIYLLDEHKSIFEIHPEFVVIPTTLYETVTLEWMISGQKDVVRSTNIRATAKANLEMNGLLDLLNPLEYYKESMTKEQLLTQRLEKLLHNPHTYGHQSDAMNIANALGLSGTHTMPDGTIMPGATHQEYLDALRQNEEVTTSSGTTISTQNLRRSSGY